MDLGISISIDGCILDIYRTMAQPDPTVCMDGDGDDDWREAA
jgi:hypothetical protein